MSKFTKNISAAWGAIRGIKDPTPTQIIQVHRGVGNHMFSVGYNGEKNFGEIGPIKDYQLEYELLRLRSWQSYLESEITQIVVKRFKKWVIGSGLRLDSMPMKMILENERVDVSNLAVNTKLIEARFHLWANSKAASYSGMKSFYQLQKQEFVEKVVGGDGLVILRVIKGNLTVQLVDGTHVKRSPFGNDFTPEVLENGNTVRNGIEMSSTGEHIAYWVTENNLEESKRIPAKTKTGIVQAFMIYGSEYRLDNHRGMPLVAVILETLKKLERYKEATVASAEERAKIVYQIVHGDKSTGENPVAGIMAKGFDSDASGEAIPYDKNGVDLANQFAATTNKTALNMTVGSELKGIDVKNEIQFGEFYNTNFDIICAYFEVPPNVAKSKYDDSFSASRAALKDWQHTLNVEREDQRSQFLQHVYNYWFELNFHRNKIVAPGYLTASKDSGIREAYLNCMFKGANVPHIDPLKEVNAEKEKMGESGKHLPLTTQEKATAALAEGDSHQNTENFAKELEQAEDLGILPKQASSEEETKTQE